MSDNKESGVGELRDLLRQLIAPVVESFDAKVSEQIDARVEKHLASDDLDARLSVLERAVAELSRAVAKLESGAANSPE